MASKGYLRFPAIYKENIIFASEDDLWCVSSDGGRAERLTAGVGRASYPRYSPDGQHVAFVGREEGPSEVFLMPSRGGAARRLTFQGSFCRVLGWAPNGDSVLYASNAEQFSPRYEVISTVKKQGGLSSELPFGMANAISYGPKGGVVLGRNIGEPAFWKRYRGGTVGHLWCDADGSGTFQRLLHLDGNIADPCWVGGRIYFISDHEGVGNIYSCTPEGEDICRHSDHQNFYARNLSSDGSRLVYHAGADLHVFDPETNSPRLLDVELPSIRTQRNRKFVAAAEYLDTYALHPEGHSIALTTRGKAFSMGNWEGPVVQHGEKDGVRYRFLEWLNDHKRLVAITDAPGREVIVVFDPDVIGVPKVFTTIDFGRVLTLEVSPTDDIVVITNHRNQLIVVDLENETIRVLDHSDYDHIRHVSWSPDGRWVAYSAPISSQKRAIKLAHLESAETHQITNPILYDTHPSFDPEGKYLYFIGQRIFSPVYDSLQFDLSFPRGTKPYAILLRRNQRSPFIPQQKSPDSKKKEEATIKLSEARDAGKDTKEKGAREENTRPTPIVIDLDGIAGRVLAFPVREGRYRKIRGIKGKALFLAFPIDDPANDVEDEDQPKGFIDAYDFEHHKTERLIESAYSFDLSRDSKTLVFWGKEGLRVFSAGEKTSKLEDNDKASRESGWLDLERIKVSVQPAAEWKQMIAEAWRLQDEQFWSANMTGIDWRGMYDRYALLVDRVSSRSELSDLLWELQGELGVSHAYEWGGEYRDSPYYRQGFLGVDWRYDSENDRYRIARIVRGDPAESRATSPLAGSGLDIAEGDAVLAINGQPIGGLGCMPQELLVNQSRNEVQLTVEDAETKEIRIVSVKPLHSDFPPRNRDWIESNRRLVHEVSNNQVGYIYIPDMGTNGFAEFHRGFLAEYDYPSLLVDLRWNGGGHVSGLLLEKLARRRLGYDISRWRQPEPYPSQSPRGPMVALMNEHTASDGDIFCHSFKLMGLGPLIGMRSWGGVIGYIIRHTLVDGTVTTQPEFFSWFKDVGWKVENYGTDPDIEVDIAPQDFVQHKDPQLQRAIVEAIHQISKYPSLEPELKESMQ